MKTEFFGYCDRCYGDIRPVWFTEEEIQVVDGHQYHTGRTRRAVSHLECICCMKKFCVDDTFDGPWR